jgi:DhnA family fructose-bisphosphate aldolase class Ia
MMYPRADAQATAIDPEHVAHAVRIAMELGVDLVKVPYTGSRESFARVLEDVDVPVLVAGGARLASDEAILRFVDDVLGAGAAGVTFGRNIFQSENPVRLARAVTTMVHHRMSLGDALSVLGDERALSEARPIALPRDVPRDELTSSFPTALGAAAGARAYSR